MRSIKKESAILQIIGLTFILAGLIVLFLGEVVDCVASDLTDLECAARNQTSAAVAFDRQHLKSGGLMFQTTYREQDWAGDLIAVCVDSNGDPTECVCKDQSETSMPCPHPLEPERPEIKWSAEGLAAVIDANSAESGEDGWWRQRAVLTMHGDAKTGIPFHYDLISSVQRNSLRNDPDLVAYIRGDHSLEGSRFRERSSYYGDFIHFVPTTYGSILLAGSNDGMLHVFDEASGHEYFSYIPALVYRRWVDGSGDSGAYQDNLAVLGDLDYADNHRYFVDGGVAVKYLEDSTTTLATDPYIGMVYGTPQIAKLPYPEVPGYKWCVIFGNGYRSHHQVPVLYIVDAYDGSVVKRIIASNPEQTKGIDNQSECSDELGCNGLSTPELVDSDNDGLIDYAYAGDLRGNLWKFDFTGGSIFGADGYTVAFQGPASDESLDNWGPKPLVSARDSTGRPQPIMTAPTVIRPCSGSGSGLMVLFGTGWVEQTAPEEVKL